MSTICPQAMAFDGATRAAASSGVVRTQLSDYRPGSGRLPNSRIRVSSYARVVESRQRSAAGLARRRHTSRSSRQHLENMLRSAVCAAAFTKGERAATGIFQPAAARPRGDRSVAIKQALKRRPPDSLAYQLGERAAPTCPRQRQVGARAAEHPAEFPVPASEPGRLLDGQPGTEPARRFGSVFEEELMHGILRDVERARAQSPWC